MNTLDCIKTRRSIRKYADQEVPIDIILKLVEIGTLAPTANGAEPWGFAVIQGVDEVRSLSDSIKEYLVKNISVHPQFGDFMKPIISDKSNLFFGAPSVIAIYGDSNYYWSHFDGTLAAENIILAAHDIGLGSCLVGYAEPYLNSDEGKIRFNIPETYQLVGAMALGFPNQMHSPPLRKPAKIFYGSR